MELLKLEYTPLKVGCTLKTSRGLHLKTSRAFHACQLMLLREETALKRSRIKILEKDFSTRKRKLRGTLGIIDYTHVCCLHLKKNDKKLKNKECIHSKKLFNLDTELS